MLQGQVSFQNPGNYIITLRGIGQSSGASYTFTAICGAQAPTITGGYATWQNIDRPLQRALTVFSGYEPVQMTVNIIFGDWLQGWADDSDAATPGDAVAGPATENDIAILDWMGGGTNTVGPSPIVYAAAFLTASPTTQSDLIPPTVRDVPWVVSGISWGKAYRNQFGSRIYQEATVTLSHFQALQAPPPADWTVKGEYVTSDAGRDTALQIAGSKVVNAQASDVQTLARSILSSAHNNHCKDAPKISLKGRSINWAIKHGTKVWVPAHISGTSG